MRFVQSWDDSVIVVLTGLLTTAVTITSAFFGSKTVLTEDLPVWEDQASASAPDHPAGVLLSASDKAAVPSLSDQVLSTEEDVDAMNASIDEVMQELKHRQRRR
jgi:hypothetical protein